MARRIATTVTGPSKATFESTVLNWTIAIGVGALVLWAELKTYQQHDNHQIPPAAPDGKIRVEGLDIGVPEGTNNLVDAEKEKSRADIRNESTLTSMSHLSVAAAKEWSAHRAASKGAALALYVLFALAPMLVLIVTIAGFVFGVDVVLQSLVEEMSGLIGSQGAETFKTLLTGQRAERGGLIAGSISAVLLLVSATSAFAELKDSLD